METIEMINILLLLCLGTLYPYVNGKIAMLEEKIREEMDEQIAEISEDVKDTISGIGDQIQDVGKFDPEDQFQMIKLNLFQHFSQMAVQYFGNKFGGTLGVHQIETPPDAPPLTDGDSIPIIDD